MGVYPDYTGVYFVTGWVVISEEYASSATIRITCYLGGLEPSSSGLVQIHEGTSCAADEDLGDPRFDTTDGLNPWTEQWTSNALGSSKTTFVIDSGYTAFDYLGHAVIVENGNGERLACGMFFETNSPTFSPTPLPSTREVQVLLIGSIVAANVICALLIFLLFRHHMMTRAIKAANINNILMPEGELPIDRVADATGGKQ